MPDIHRGDTAAGKSDFVAWIKEKSDWETIMKADFDALLKELQREGIESIGSIGFCFGGWAFSKAASQGFPLKCGVSAHPSIKIEDMVGGSQLGMMKSFSCPVLLLCAGNDDARCKPGGDVADVVISNGGGSFVYERMIHGWVARGDVSDEAVKEDTEDAMKKAVS